MNKYEVLYILKNDVADEVKQAIVDKLSEVVTSSGGTVESVDKWGTKRFAYPIDYQNDGYYVLMNFEANAEVPAELERQIRITDEAIRCMVVRK